MRINAWESIRRQTAAFTLIELIAILSVMVGATVLLIEVNSRNVPRKGGHPPSCVKNLKQLGLAFKIFAGDNDDRYPYARLSGLTAGDETRAWLHFQAMSNELATAWVLRCPKDLKRRDRKAENFAWGSNANAKSLMTFGNDAVSYFINLETVETRPQAILAGDFHVAPKANSSPYSSRPNGAALIKVGAQWSTAFDNNPHGGDGVLLLGDGSVNEVNNLNLKNQMQLSVTSYGANANRFLFPQ